MGSKLSHYFMSACYSISIPILVCCGLSSLYVLIIRNKATAKIILMSQLNLEDLIGTSIYHAFWNFANCVFSQSLCFYSLCCFGHYSAHSATLTTQTQQSIHYSCPNLRSVKRTDENSTLSDTLRMGAVCCSVSSGYPPVMGYVTASHNDSPNFLIFASSSSETPPADVNTPISLNPR